MKINREQLAALMALSDDALWREIRRVAAEKGFSLPEATPCHADMERLRATASDADRVRLGDALRVIDEYRKRGGSHG